MDPRRRLIIPKWLKDLAKKWRNEEGFTHRQIQARLADIGVHVSIATIAGWFSHARRVNEVLRNL